MLGLFAIVAVGFFLGMRHATDPDHVIAVSTIISREGSLKRASLIGAAWGVGHTMTVLVVGSAMILFRIVLPPRLGLAMELAVGLMLIFLGLRNLSGVFSWSTERATINRDDNLTERFHYHARGDYVHAHSHAGESGHLHDPRRNAVAVMDAWFKGSNLYHCMRPLLVGVIHGLAGSAAIALLVLGTIPTVRWGIAYLAVFGIGTILGMVIITVTIGSTLAYARKRFLGLAPHLAWAAGLISVAFGLFMAYHIGFVQGLFNNHPR